MKRREAREQAFILLFERSVNLDTIDEIIDAAEMSGDFFVDEFAARLAQGAQNHEADTGNIIERHIHGWKLTRLSKVCLSVLRLAVYEMLYEEEIPVSVSINEAVELAKKYGSADDAPYVNGVLGAVARELAEQNA